jgi:hypothetical protein
MNFLFLAELIVDKFDQLVQVFVPDFNVIKLFFSITDFLSQNICHLQAFSALSYNCNED